MRRVLAALAVGYAVWFGAPLGLYAQPTTEDEARAMALFEAAAQHFRAGRFREAIELLDEADRLKPSGILHYNKARAYEGLADKPSALREYQKYVELSPDAPDRGAVEGRIATLRGEMEETARLERERRAAVERAKAAAARQPLPPARGRPSAIPWVVAGVGLAGVAVGGYFGIRAISEEAAGNDAPSQVEAYQHANTAHDSARAANVALAAGAAVLVLGAGWGLVDVALANRRSSKRARDMPRLRASSE